VGHSNAGEVDRKMKFETSQLRCPQQRTPLEDNENTNAVSVLSSCSCVLVRWPTAYLDSQTLEKVVKA
jgi:hypothetical protein